MKITVALDSGEAADVDLGAAGIEDVAVLCGWTPTVLRAAPAKDEKTGDPITAPDGSPVMDVVEQQREETPAAFLLDHLATALRQRLKERLRVAGERTVARGVTPVADALREETDAQRRATKTEAALEIAQAKLAAETRRADAAEAKLVEVTE